MDDETFQVAKRRAEEFGVDWSDEKIREMEETRLALVSAESGVYEMLGRYIHLMNRAEAIIGNMVTSYFGIGGTGVHAVDDFQAWVLGSLSLSQKVDALGNMLRGLDPAEEPHPVIPQLRQAIQRRNQLAHGMIDPQLLFNPNGDPEIFVLGQLGRKGYRTEDIHLERLADDISAASAVYDSLWALWLALPDLMARCGQQHPSVLSQERRRKRPGGTSGGPAS